MTARVSYKVDVRALEREARQLLRGQRALGDVVGRFESAVQQERAGSQELDHRLSRIRALEGKVNRARVSLSLLRARARFAVQAARRRAPTPFRPKVKLRRR